MTTTYQQSPYINSPNYQLNNQNEHQHQRQQQQYHQINNIKKSSKSVSKYVQTSSMLINSPNNYIQNHKIKNANSMCAYNNSNNNNINNTNNNNIINSPHMNTVFSAQQQQNNYFKHISRLQSRIQSSQVKISSLTNIVRLLQKYSQTKDDQYEKQKQHILFNRTLSQKIQHIDCHQLDNKVKQFNNMMNKMKKQIQQIQSIKSKYQISIINNNNNPINQIEKQQQYNNNHNHINNKKFHSNKSKLSDIKSPASQSSLIDIDDINMAFQQMQKRLRQQINKKIQICMKQIKKINTDINNNNNHNHNINNIQQINGVDQHIFQQQINSLNFQINKIQNQCLRNKMIVQKQIQQIVSMLPTSTNRYYDKNITNNSNRNHSNNNSDYFPYKQSQITSQFQQQKHFQKAIHDKSHSRKKSQRSSISKQKSKSNLKNNINHNNNNNNQIDKKKIKEEQLKQAIRRKKQTKDKIKAKNY